MNADAINSRSAALKKRGGSGQTGGAPGQSGEGVGRPQKEDNQKSEKTLKNKESM